MRCMTAVLASVLLPLLMCASGCMGNTSIRPPAGRQPVAMTAEITGYCNCGKCCSWERPWWGFGIFGSPVISSGANKGKPKIVGQTASGAQARRGTIAADTSVLPFGTIIYVEGYGYGRVEDRGGAIKGTRLDLWFSSHDEALKWGRKKNVSVKVWKP